MKAIDEAMPIENRKVFQLVQLKANGNVASFARMIDERQQSINRLFNPDPRSGNYPIVKRDLQNKLVEMFNLDRAYFVSDSPQPSQSGIQARLNNVYESSGQSMANFARDCGIDVNNLRKMLNGKQPITKKTILKVGQAKSINPDWLYYGEGERERADVPKGIPVYEVDFAAGFMPMFNDSANVADTYANLPSYSKATAIVGVTGDSMYPLISSGDKLILRQMPLVPESLMFGKIYAVVLRNDMRTVKRLRKSDVEGCVDLEPVNKEVADTTTVRLEDILFLWQVLGCIKSFM